MSMIVRNTLVLVGLVAVLGAGGLWQFGFLNKKYNEVSQQIARETAVTRAENIILEHERKASQLSEQASQLRINARARELALERDQKAVDKTREAMKTLSKAAKEAGAPKPTEAKPEDLAKTVAVAGRSLTLSELYRNLERWQKQAQSEEQLIATSRLMIDRQRKTAEQLEQKQELLRGAILETRGKLEQLAMQRDLVKMEKDLAELTANADGNFHGKLGTVLDTLQKEIDESLATIEVLGQKSGNNAALTPDQVLTETKTDVELKSELDKLWN